MKEEYTLRASHTPGACTGRSIQTLPLFIMKIDSRSDRGYDRRRGMPSEGHALEPVVPTLQPSLLRASVFSSAVARAQRQRQRQARTARRAPPHQRECQQRRCCGVDE